MWILGCPVKMSSAAGRRKVRTNHVNNQHFIACLECSRQSLPLTTTEVCIRQTRNDGEVTDQWKWWAIIFLYKRKQEKKELHSTSSKNKKKERKKKLLQDESTVTAPGLPPKPHPLHPQKRSFSSFLTPSLPLEVGEKKTECCGRGRKRVTEWQRAGWLVKDETIAF